MGVWFDLAEPEPPADEALEREVRPWLALGCAEVGRRTARETGRGPSEDDPVMVFLAHEDVLVGLRVVASETVVTLRTVLVDGSLVETLAAPETFWRSAGDRAPIPVGNRSVEVRRGLSASEALRDHRRHVDRVAAARGTARSERSVDLGALVDLWHRCADHDVQLAAYREGVDPGPAVRRVLLVLTAVPFVLAVDLLLLDGAIPLLLVAAVALVLVALVDALWVRGAARRTTPPAFPVVG